MPHTESILRILDDALGLQGRALAFGPETRLLGALPELDSMAVLALVSGMENHFGIHFDDADLSAATFHTVGSLCDLATQALARQGP
jgi:acyl carrier protein